MAGIVAVSVLLVASEHPRETIGKVATTIAPPKGPDVKKTLASIFQVLKETKVTKEQFAGMMDAVGVTSFAAPPDGWMYVNSSDGIYLKRMK